MGFFIQMLTESGNIYEFVTAPFTNILGSYFYLFMAFMAMGMIYLKTQDITMPAVVGLLFAGAFAMKLPHEAGVAILILLAISIAALFYRVLKS